ncbi:hypothetical protein EX30DRAFT_396719 [Ascodesmis nigricans]|uniref:N(6)-L-threonylcarbamoyladenine synthase n=1 Tax=Ascodesmis nigricans TaxID=341454 RepID=A0A4V3SIF3_9PEZI|nr:hypothetical protein EX30DRAFT_396719 [Ascodesmis nigricans]
MPPRLLSPRRPPWLTFTLQRPQYRRFTVLGIETSCDDTSIALLHAPPTSAPQLLYHRTVTSSNRIYRGVHPVVSLNSHRTNLAPLIQECLSLHPDHRPDLISATRGPGMAGALAVGYDTAQGLSVGLGIPFIGVNHMHAHLLTSRMVESLSGSTPLSLNPNDPVKFYPKFPFLTLLVSGGHTMLVHSRSLLSHKIIANTIDVAVGDMIDKAARDLLPESYIASSSGKQSNKDAICYGQLLEDFCFPSGGGVAGENYVYFAPGTKARKAQNKALLEKYGDWGISEPLKKWDKGKRAAVFSFGGMGSEVDRALQKNKISEDDVETRRAMGRETMVRAFEHVISRAVMALEAMPFEERLEVRDLVVSGGVASNGFLRHMARVYLKEKGFWDVRLVTPPPKFCTDNAAMIAWTGLEMWRDGWRTELGVYPIRKWTLDSEVGAGDVEKGLDVVAGLMGADGWVRRDTE